LEWMIYLHLWNPCHLIFWSYFEQSKANLDRVHNHAITFSHSLLLFVMLFVFSIQWTIEVHFRKSRGATSCSTSCLCKECHIWPRETFHIRVWYVLSQFYLLFKSSWTRFSYCQHPNWSDIPISLI
jgi:hypothetical protein